MEYHTQWIADVTCL